MRWVLAPWEPVPASGFPGRRCALAGLIEQRPGGPEPWSELELRDGSGTIALVTEGADVALAARGIDALPDLPLMGRLADAAPSDRSMLLDLLRQVGLTAGEIREALGADTGAARLLAVIDALTATRPRPVIDDHGEIRPGEERAPRPKPIPGTFAGGAYGDWLTLVDDCARADQGPPPGPGWAAFTSNTDRLRLESNLIRPDTTGNCTEHWDTATDDADSEVAAALSAVPSGSFDYLGVYIRGRQPGASTADGYFAGVRNGGGNLDYYRMDNGGYTQLGATIGSAGFAAADWLGLNVTGTTLDARRYRSGAWGSALGTRTDSTYTAAGYPALYIQPDGRVSAFHAGPYGAPEPPPAAAVRRRRALLGVGR